MFCLRERDIIWREGKEEGHGYARRVRGVYAMLPPRIFTTQRADGAITLIRCHAGDMAEAQPRRAGKGVLREASAWWRGAFGCRQKGAHLLPPLEVRRRMARRAAARVPVVFPRGLSRQIISSAERRPRRCRRCQH